MGNRDRVRLLVASDHLILRESIVRLLIEADAFEIETRALSAAISPTWAADVCLYILEPRQLEIALQRRSDACRDFFFFLGRDDDAIIAALKAGATGILEDHYGSLNSHDLVEAIKQVAAGGFVLPAPVAMRLARLHTLQSANIQHREDWLTQREQEVLCLLAEGGSNREIAERLCLSEHTVRAHLRGIMQKLQVSSRAQAVAMAWKENLVPTMAARRPDGNSNSRG